MTYLYEQLSPEKFQKLCQSIISSEFPDTQCFPVAQPDGGRDSIAWTTHIPGKRAEFIAFQVKFSRDSDRAANQFLDDILENELPKIRGLLSRGLKAYYLLTNVRGTAHLDAGSIDRMQRTLSTSIEVPALCWWRDDLDRRIDSKSDIKWSYPEIIRGTDLLQSLITGPMGEEGRRRDSAIKAYITEQYREDREVKFKQVDLYNNLFDLFVDTNLAPISTSDESHRVAGLHPYYETEHFRESAPRAAKFLLDGDTTQRIVLEGAPGQGKSTITQYICQVHRVRLLDRALDRSKIQPDYFSGTLRIPLRVDLRDYASWISGRNPFSSDLSSVRPTEMPISLESFLAFQIGHTSGGHAFSVSDLASLARDSHLLIVLDGFDEVADIATRMQAVKEISKAAGRLEAASKSLLIVVTSRPAAFAKSPGFSDREWLHMTLLSMSFQQINSYAAKWMSARSLPSADKEKFKEVLKEKLDQPHMRDLARNPMQLAILLSLIQTKGLSLPDKRTALYDSYIDLFFSREAEKSPIVREHRDLLIELHRYLAWMIQIDAEDKRGAGSIADERLRALLRDYLAREGHQTNLVDDLFTGMTERVVALVSRVQGTFEFEVQPLREYFAARHLYETAPYSPPGQEKSGTKPERFDALARNFYWLNVTRFYCGCYSRGELSSLADGLIQLSELDGFKEIAYPRLLILMLLGDWVFTQQPHVIKRLLAHLSKHPGFKIILANAIRDRATSSLIPPERCGRNDILEAISDWFYSGISSDVCVALATSARESLSQEVAIEFWKSLRQPGKEASWFTLGRFVGAFHNISFVDARDLFEEFPKELVFSLQFANRSDIIESDIKMFEVASRQILAGHGLASLRGTGSAITFLSAFRIALDPSTYTILFERDPSDFIRGSSYRSLISSRRHIETFENYPSDIPTAPFLDNDASKRFLRTFYEAIELPCKDWMNSLRPWSEIVEAGAREWGRTPALLDIALISAGISAKEERGAFGAGFDDKSIPLCETLRYARLKSGAYQWWLSNLNRGSEHLVALTTLLCWATPRTILLIKDCVGPLVDALERRAWHRLVDRIKRTVSIWGRSDASGLALREVQSDRLFLALALRLSPVDRDQFICSKFIRYSGDDRKILEMACDSAVRLACAGILQWSDAVDMIRRGYMLDIDPITLHRAVSSEFRIPEELAIQICTTAQHFPLALVYNAQSVLQASIAATGKPVGEIALRDQWFG